MTTQVVLVPGFWLGAWAWDDVTKLLLDRGFDVEALTLPGLDGGTTDVGPVDHAEAIIAALDPDADRRVLVVHSGAAVPGTIVLDQRPGLVDHIVFVDTAPVTDGFAVDADLSTPTLDLDSVWDDQYASGTMRDLTDEQLATFKERAVLQPGRTISEPVHLNNPARLAVAGTVVCTAFSSDDYKKYAAEGASFLAALPEHTALTYVDLPTSHWPMWSKPTELAEVIERSAMPESPRQV